MPPDRQGTGGLSRTASSALRAVVMLATELYHRGCASLPTSEEALVGTYLNSLPDDRPPDFDDGTAPTVY